VGLLVAAGGGREARTGAYRHRGTPVFQSGRDWALL
jgi:hypothetical protein